MARTLDDDTARRTAPAHGWLDDAQGIATGTLLIGLGLALFAGAGLLAGGTAGLALLLQLATGAPFGALFFALNLPCYAFAWRRLGARFTLKTFAAVSLLSLFAEALPRLVRIDAVDPWFAAVGGGALIGVGLLILFRHGASLGGLNVLVLWLQQRTGWRAGAVQAAIDAAILAAGLPWLDRRQVALSIAGALVLNFALAVNHRPGRYTAC